MPSDRILSITIRSKEVNAWGCFFGTDSNYDINSLPSSCCGEIRLSNSDDDYIIALHWNSYFLIETPQKYRYNAILFIRTLSASKPFIPGFL